MYDVRSLPSGPGGVSVRLRLRGPKDGHHTLSDQDLVGGSVVQKLLFTDTLQISVDDPPQKERAELQLVLSQNLRLSTISTRAGSEQAV